MRKLPKLIIVSFYIFLTASFGGAAEEINVDILNISEKAKALLKKEQKHWCDPIAEGVNTFSFDGNPVTSVVLGMDGENAEIIEYNKFSCKVGYGRSGGGSGGYPLVVVIEDVIYDLDLVRTGWEVANLGWNLPVLLLSRHGSFCNRSGTYACLQAFVYHDKVLSTPTSWMEVVREEVAYGKDLWKGVDLLKVEIE